MNTAKILTRMHRARPSKQTNKRGTDVAANTSNGNVVTMVDVNAKSIRSMYIDPSQFKSIAKAVVDNYCLFKELDDSITFDALGIEETFCELFKIKRRN